MRLITLEETFKKAIQQNASSSLEDPLPGPSTASGYGVQRTGHSSWSGCRRWGVSLCCQAGVQWCDYSPRVLDSSDPPTSASQRRDFTMLPRLVLNSWAQVICPLRPPKISGHFLGAHWKTGGIITQGALVAAPLTLEYVAAAAAAAAVLSLKCITAAVQGGIARRLGTAEPRAGVVLRRTIMRRKSGIVSGVDLLENLQITQ
ncbi:hypothetical protein AAY473_040271 [Plecturocebus cupreus]